MKLPKKPAAPKVVVPDLETLFTHPKFWGVETATPVQRMFCRVIEGRPFDDLADDPAVRWCFGGDEAVDTLLHGGPKPKQISLYGAVRCGKSDLASCAAFWMSQTIKFGSVTIKPHEVPRIAILATKIDTARPTFNHLIGRLLRPEFAGLIVGKPTSDSVTVRHPSGRHVEICAIAGGRAGGSLIARWLGGVVFDEKPRMLSSEDDAVTNYEDAHHNVVARLMEGAQIIDLGSPFAPQGPAYDDVQKKWGKPTRHHVVLRFRGFDTNPYVWTEERCSNLLDADPAAYKTEVLGEFKERASAALGLEDVAECTRNLGNAVGLGAGIGVIDSSSGRGDAWTFGSVQFVNEVSPESEYLERDIYDASGNRTMRVPVFDDATGKPIPNPNRKPPSPRLYCTDLGAFEGKFADTTSFASIVAYIASVWKSSGITHAFGDQYLEYALESEFSKHGITFKSRAWTSQTKVDATASLRRLLREKILVIEPGEEAEKLRKELLQLEEKFLASGALTVQSKRGATGHGDRAMMLLLVARLEAEGEIAGSPIRRFTKIGVYDPYGAQSEYA